MAAKKKTATKKAATKKTAAQKTAAAQDEVRGVALLRGINLNGRNALSMPALKGMVEDAGGRDVVTYIASGNVVFTMPQAKYATLHDVLEARILKDTAMKVPIVLRTHQQLVQVMERNPFLQKPPAERQLYVMFLSSTPTKAQAASLDPQRSPGDEFVVDGDVVYLALRTAADTKITNAWIDKALTTTSTSRNLNTTRKLLELCAATSS